MKHNIIAISIVGIALAVTIVVLGGVSWNRASAPTEQARITENNIPAGAISSSAVSSTLSTKTYTTHPPHGSVTYEIVQAATQLPGFAQATIDPVDVAVGNIQHFTVITNDPNPVASVVAVITTDHKTITVPLVSNGVPAVSLLVPRRAYITGAGQLALIAPDIDVSNIAEIKKGAHIANAADSDDTKFTGQWTVEDTHTAKYSTTFVAKDSIGNTNSVTLQWTDPCPFSVGVGGYATGTVNLNNSCNMMSGNSLVSSVDGPDRGNLNLGSFGNLIIDPGAELVINSGFNINMAPMASIAFADEQNPGASIVLGEDMCGIDLDGDGYINSASWVATSSCSGLLVSRASIASTAGFGDCDDLDSNAYPGQLLYFYTPEVGPTSTEQAIDSAWPWDFNCDKNRETNPRTYSMASSSAECVPLSDSNGSYCGLLGVAPTTVPTSSCGTYVGGLTACALFPKTMGGIPPVVQIWQCVFEGNNWPVSCQ